MMMKKTLVAAAVASCFTTMAAHAVHVSQDGTGQVLLYPYYNVNGGNQTFVNVTNTTNTTKAVKVRFREGVGSEDVFDFTLYLSPYDVWVARINQENGDVMLTVPADTSCTVPQSLSGNSFLTNRIDSTYDPDGDGTQTAAELTARLSEGHIEVIEMATLGAGDITTNVVHVSGTPTDCSVPSTFTGNAGAGGVPAILDDATTATYGGVTQVFNTPTGGLYGSAAIFDPSSGIYFPYNATALESFAANPIWWPQNSQVFTAVEGAGAGVDSGANPISNYYTADDSTVITAAGVLNFDLPDLSTPTTAEVTADLSIYHAYSVVDATGVPAINEGNFGGEVLASNTAAVDKARAVSAALTGNTITGDYITSGAYATDWIITFPTRYLQVSENSHEDPFDIVDPNAGFVATEEDLVSGQACVEAGFNYWDREEAANTGDVGVGISPGVPPEAFVLCYEVNVLSMDSSGSATSSDAVNADLSSSLQYTDGWAEMDLTAHTVTPTALVAGDASGDIIGLPVLGFTAVSNIVSGSNKGGVFPSRVTVDKQ
jgi:hypothetical protein